MPQRKFCLIPEQFRSDVMRKHSILVDSRHRDTKRNNKISKTILLCWWHTSRWDHTSMTRHGMNNCHNVGRKWQGQAVYLQDMVDRDNKQKVKAVIVMIFATIERSQEKACSRLIKHFRNEPFTEFWDIKDVKK